MGDALWQVAFGVVLLTKSAGTTRSLSRSLLLPLLLLTERQWRHFVPLRVVLVPSVLVARWQCGCWWQREQGGVGCSVVGVTWRVCGSEIGLALLRGLYSCHAARASAQWFGIITCTTTMWGVDVARVIV